jgi:predicted PurR-regulated permease PerM
MAQNRIPQSRRTAIFFLTALLCIALSVAYVIGRPFLPMLAYSVILATVFHPLQQRLLRCVHNPGRAALISTSILFLLIVIPLILVFNMAARQAVGIAREIGTRSASEGGIIPFLAGKVDRAILFAGRYVDLSGFDVQAQLQAYTKRLGIQLLPTAGAMLTNLVGFIFNSFLALITVYFLLRDGDRIVDYALGLLPLSEDHARRLLGVLKDSITANIQGVFAVGAAQGLATGLALAALGVSSATLLGIFAAFCSLLPLVGTALVWGPVAILLIATGHIVKGLILLGLGAGIISQLDNVVRPLVVGKRVQANSLVLIIAMLGGVQAFGFLGLFVGPIAVALIVAVSKMLREEIAESHEEDTPVRHEA